MPGPMGGPGNGRTLEKAKLFIKIQNWINNCIYIFCWKHNIFNSRA